MTDCWPIVADTETADLQEFVSEYKHNLGVKALWKVARIVAGEAGVTLQAFGSWDEVEAHQEGGSDSAPSATTGRAPGSFGGSLLAATDSTIRCPMMSWRDSRVAMLPMPRVARRERASERWARRQPRGEVRLPAR